MVLLILDNFSDTINSLPGVLNSLMDSLNQGESIISPAELKMAFYNIAPSLKLVSRKLRG